MIRTLHRIALAVSLAAFLFTGANALTATAPAVAAPGPRSAASARAEATPALQGKLNLNNADEEQLRLLPGIGKTKAARIVAWRKKHGRFKRVKDLRRVKGFGRKSVAKLAPYLVVTGPTTLRKGR